MKYQKYIFFTPKINRIIKMHSLAVDVILSKSLTFYSTKSNGFDELHVSSCPDYKHGMSAANSMCSGMTCDKCFFEVSHEF